MRSLEEWTKYLEQQEQALERSSQPSFDAEVSGVRETIVSSPKEAVFVSSYETFESDAHPSEKSEGQPKDDDSSIISTARKLRKKIPSILTSFDNGDTEVAQNSYGAFKETREELLQRLLDPQLTLEDTARILNVCPTTVRRYTNRGLLKHVRTAGNQRRFRLSDVLNFMESQSSNGYAEEAE